MSTDYMFNWNLPHPLYVSVMTLVVIGAVVMVVEVVVPAIWVVVMVVVVVVPVPVEHD